MRLSMVDAGIKLKVIDILGGRNMRQRLASMGIYLNSIIQIDINSFNGPVVVKSNNTRIGIGRSMANKIIVEPV